MTENYDRFSQSAARAARWIVSRQKSDGSFFDLAAGIGGYYKVPYALATTGFTPQATRLLAWVRANHLTDDGDFRGPSRKARISLHDEWPTYGNAWLIMGAHRLSQFDLSFRGVDFLTTLRAPCGGFCAMDDDKPYVECLGTSWSGLAALTVGNLAVAESAARCLQSLVDQQPQPDRFYYRLSTDGKLATDVPDGQALAYYVDATRPKQVYFHPGIAMIFLCRYYLATHAEWSLDTARSVFDFTQRCRDDVYRFPPSGKLGLGCALLAAITNDAKARQAALDVADYLAGTQTDDGYWLLPDEEIYAGIENKDDPEIRMDITAEFATFLVEIAAAV